jgi:hypothetical protein
MFIKTDGTAVVAVAYTKHRPPGWIQVPDQPLERMKSLEDWQFLDGVLSRAGGSAYKARFRDLINEAVGKVRTRYITDIPGQEMIYLEKRNEAFRFLSQDPEPESLADFPLLAAEAGITAPTARDLAELWMAQAATMVSVAASLETVRLGAISEIENSASLEEAEVVFAEFESTLATL